jgi:hypothetical protein
MADRTKIKTARVQMFIDDAASAFEVTIGVSNFNQVLPVTSARTGATPIGYLMEGHPGSIACEFLERDAAEFERALATDANGRAVEGTMLPTHVVRLHNPMDADTANDIVIPAAVFTNFGMTGAATGAGGYTCDLMIVKPADLTLPEYWIGYTAVEPPGDNNGGYGTEPAVPVP